MVHMWPQYLDDKTTTKPTFFCESFDSEKLYRLYFLSYLFSIDICESIVIGLKIPFKIQFGFSCYQSLDNNH